METLPHVAATNLEQVFLVERLENASLDFDELQKNPSYLGMLNVRNCTNLLPYKNTEYSNHNGKLQVRHDIVFFG